MYSIETGFFPMAGLMAAGLLYAAYYGLVRLRCTTGWAQMFITTSIVLSTILTLVSPVRMVEAEPERIYGAGILAPTQPVAVEEISKEAVPVVQTVHIEAPNVLSPAIQKETRSYDVLLQDASTALGWLYVVGIAMVILHFVGQFLWHARERNANPLLSVTEEARIYATSYLQPFSFGRSIFLPSSLSGETRHFALVHELSHVRHHHFQKLCLLELLLAVNWFNPFVWVFFNEMKLQQEMETDGDVLSTGIDRCRYQMSLLEVAVQHSRWLIVQSAFGTKPIKQRIIFMNKTFDTQSMRRRLMAAAGATMLALAVTLSAGCQANKQEIPATHHDLYGIWTLDFTRPAGSQKEIYPPFKQYGFYSDDVFFTLHFWMRDGNNMAFGYSGEGLEVKDGQLVFTDGLPAEYHFVSENTFQTNWKKKMDDNALVNAEVITDQWSRSTPDSTVMRLFHTACKAEQAHDKPLDGVWRSEEDDEMLLINGDMILMLSYIQKDSTAYRFGGAGFFMTLTYNEDNTVTITGGNEKTTVHWEKRDKDVIVMTSENKPEETLAYRTTLPQHIRRILNATLIDNP